MPVKRWRSQRSLPLYDGAAMRALDRWAIDECGTPGLMLMEQAGAGLAQVVAELAPSGRIVVVCGVGNNGGDGYVAARLLRGAGREVEVLTCVPTERLRGDALTNLRSLPGAAPQPFAARRLNGAAVIVDAILGTGASGPPREPIAAAIAAINAAAAKVVAADLPSGVDADSGEVVGVAVRADRTATFAAHKLGAAIAPGKHYCGATQLVELSLPPDWPVEPSATLIGADALRTMPPRQAQSTKFTSGQVIVAGGSRGMSGAVCLAAAAATRAGGGYVIAAVPAALHEIVETRLVEVMTPLLAGAKQGQHDVVSAQAVAELLAARPATLVLGPGLGRSESAQAFAQRLAALAPGPLVLDADGLTAHAGMLERLSVRGGPAVLTPHAGELARLLELDSAAAVESSRLASARAAADRSGAIVVLKGDDTLVVEPGDGACGGGRVAVSPGGVPALATAGSGDVLAGITGALLARGMPPLDAACGAVYLHLAAGSRAAVRCGGNDGVVAGDVVAALPRALGRLLKAAGQT